METSGTIKATLSGVAVVCCVHDREKRQVRTEAQVAELGREVGVEYDPRQHKLFDCACCQNLFVANDDEPKFCHVCRGAPVHALAGPPAEPTGVIS